MLGVIVEIEEDGVGNIKGGKVMLLGLPLKSFSLGPSPVYERTRIFTVRPLFLKVFPVTVLPPTTTSATYIVIINL